MPRELVLYPFYERFVFVFVFFFFSSSRLAQPLDCGFGPPLGRVWTRCADRIPISSPRCSPPFLPSAPLESAPLRPPRPLPSLVSPCTSRCRRVSRTTFSGCLYSCLDSSPRPRVYVHSCINPRDGVQSGEKRERVWVLYVPADFRGNFSNEKSALDISPLFTGVFSRDRNTNVFSWTTNIEYGAIFLANFCEL